MASMINVLAAEGLGDRIFGLDPQLLIDACITVVAMLFLFMLLSYLLFNPARDLMAKRQAKIQADMELGAKEKAEGMSFKQEYDAKLQNADAEVEDILREARKKALKRENEIVDEAKEEAVRIRNRAEKDVELEKQKVKDEVKQEMISVASMMAGKIVSASLSDAEQEKLIAETLEEMGDATWQN